MLYDAERIARIKELLSAIPFIEDITFSIHDGYYAVQFRLDDRKYNVIMLTQAGKTNRIMAKSIFTSFRNVWIINTAIGRYEPEDVAEIIVNLDRALIKYQTAQQQTAFNEFASIEIHNDYNEDADCIDEILAASYMRHYDITDDKYKTQYRVLAYLFSRVSLSCGERWA